MVLSMKPPDKINFARQRKPMRLDAFAALWTSRVCSHRGCGALDRGKARRTASDLKGKRRLAAVGSLGCLRSQRCLCHKSTCTPWSRTAVRVRDRPSVGRTGRVPKRSRRPHELGYRRLWCSAVGVPGTILVTVCRAIATVHGEHGGDVVGMRACWRDKRAGLLRRRPSRVGGGWLGARVCDSRTDTFTPRRRVQVETRHRLEFSELEAYHKADVDADSSVVQVVLQVRVCAFVGDARVCERAHHRPK